MRAVLETKAQEKIRKFRELTELRELNNGYDEKNIKAVEGLDVVYRFYVKTPCNRVKRDCFIVREDNAYSNYLKYVIFDKGIRGIAINKLRDSVQGSSFLENIVINYQMSNGGV